MKNIVNFYKSRLLLSLLKPFLYFLSPVLLMGMMHQGEENTYPQIYNHHSDLYNQAIGDNDGLVNDHIARLRGILVAVRNGAAHVNLRAQHYVTLAQHDSGRALAMKNRIQRIANLTTVMVVPEELVGRHDLNENQNQMLVHHRQAMAILNNAKRVYSDVNRHKDQIIDISGRAVGRPRAGTIRSLGVNVTNRLNPIINNVNVDLADYIIDYDNSIAPSLNDFNQQNILINQVENRSNDLHDQVVELGGLMVQIREQYGNIEALMPPNHVFVLVEDNINYNLI